jgi:hypothetical protein
VYRSVQKSPGGAVMFRTTIVEIQGGGSDHRNLVKDPFVHHLVCHVVQPAGLAKPILQLSLSCLENRNDSFVNVSCLRQIGQSTVDYLRYAVAEGLESK